MKALTELTAEQLKTLYKKHSLKPNSGDASVLNGCTCAIGILCVENGMPFDNKGERNYTEALKDAGFDPGIDAVIFYTGFDRGFDGMEMAESFNCNAVHKHAHALGNAMKEALVAGEFDA